MPTLDDLPREVLYEILSHLSPVSASVPSLCRHAFSALFLSSRSLHSAVESYSLHLLTKLSLAFPSSPRARLKAPYTRTYLRHAHMRCRFCDRRTRCVARVFNDVRCCRRCDTRWEGVTMTDARAEWRLGRDELLARCRWGTYMVHSVRATMLLEEDVMALARERHGDLDAWIEKRTDKWKERYRVRKEARDKRQRLRDRDAAA
ncbi:hypothetical protein BZA05DRAFT_477502 [Tricharina praecox]|uniref:uncharacterized protein n=1 Tax=Tricharina praecox TaxID=43433 RepID=UPI0022211B3F|nr:uncharacterized protein BZA05DRAFT_477502 [Tricharina praecox]KAI5842352.1 hypothetical protein BZA05DRAFT_477502 [Tricharina praecox]